jgi:hypothetical protein
VRTGTKRFRSGIVKTKCRCGTFKGHPYIATPRILPRVLRGRKGKVAALARKGKKILVIKAFRGHALSFERIHACVERYFVEFRKKASDISLEQGGQLYL